MLQLKATSGGHNVNLFFFVSEIIIISMVVGGGHDVDHSKKLEHEKWITKPEMFL